MKRKKVWRTPVNTQSEIKAAGRVIRHGDETSDAWRNALVVVDDWRAAHAFPMQVIYANLRNMMKGRRGFVAQRLKRLASIVPKLQSNTVLNLWKMQDLGGCRVVTDTLKAVYQAESRFRVSRIRHVLVKVNDYIVQPKKSGYRSLHAVYQYHSDRNPIYNNNMLIEIQFRTRMQHMWATAVETMGLYKGLRLKSGEGTKEINRFFVLASSLIALKEKTPLVPGTPCTKDLIVQELFALDHENQFLDKLSALSVAVHVKQENENARKARDGYYLLLLNFEDRKLIVRPYSTGEYDKANTAYLRLENQYKSSGKERDVVLVGVKSINELSKAYPNYFSDVKEFVNFLKWEIAWYKSSHYIKD